MLQSSARIITDTQNLLKSESDLSPGNPLVNQALSLLVSSLSEVQQAGYGEELSQLPELSGARRTLPLLCGQAEGEMETHWVQRFLAQPDFNYQSLRDFWYYANYEALWQTEHQLFGEHLGNNCVFLGGGPLPLTAIFAAMERPDTTMTCVDRDERACALSRRLVERLGLSDLITVFNGAALDYPYAADDFVICASLISGKSSLYEKLHQNKLRAFAVRDAEGAYRYLYEPAPQPEASQYREGGRTQLRSNHINTTRLYLRA